MYSILLIHIIRNNYYLYIINIGFEQLYDLYDSCIPVSFCTSPDLLLAVPCIVLKKGTQHTGFSTQNHCAKTRGWDKRISLRNYTIVNGCFKLLTPKLNFLMCSIQYPFLHSLLSRITAVESYVVIIYINRSWL